LIITVDPFLFLFQNSLKGAMRFYQSSVWALPEKMSFVNFALTLISMERRGIPETI